MLDKMSCFIKHVTVQFRINILYVKNFYLIYLNTPFFYPVP